MKSIVVFCLFFLVPSFVDAGEVPKSTLAALGLGDMKIVSDEIGMKVRGDCRPRRSPRLIITYGVGARDITVSVAPR